MRTNYARYSQPATLQLELAGMIQSIDVGAKQCSSKAKAEEAYDQSLVIAERAQLVRAQGAIDWQKYSRAKPKALGK